MKEGLWLLHHPLTFLSPNQSESQQFCQQLRHSRAYASKAEQSRIQRWLSTGLSSQPLDAICVKRKDKLIVKSQLFRYHADSARTIKGVMATWYIHSQNCQQCEPTIPWAVFLDSPGEPGFFL